MPMSPAWTAATLAAVAIPESGVMDIPQGGGGAVGPFQIDLSRNPQVDPYEAPDWTWSAGWTASELASNAAAVAAKFPWFTPAQVLQGAANSHNMWWGRTTGTTLGARRRWTGALLPAKGSIRS